MGLTVEDLFIDDELHDSQFTEQAKDRCKYTKAIYDKLIPFIETDKEDVYSVLKMNVHYSVIAKPYVYVWIKILNSHKFYNGKNKVHNMTVRNPIGLHPQYIDIKVDVKAF